jgi:hypothetical protein
MVVHSQPKKFLYFRSLKDSVEQDSDHKKVESRALKKQKKIKLQSQSRAFIAAENASVNGA